MRLATKLISGILVAIFLLLVLDTYLSVRRDTKLAMADMERDTLLLGHTMKRLVLETWRTHGQQRAMELFDETNRGEHQINVRWVWLDAAAGEERRPLVSDAELEPVIHGKPITVQNRSPSGDGYLVTYIPLSVDGQRPTAIELSEPLADLQRFARSAIVKTLLLATALLFVGGLAIVALGTLLVGHPLRDMVTKIRQIGQAGLTAPLAVSGHDELAELAGALNAMYDELTTAQKKVREEADAKVDALEQLQHADRLKTAGLVASGIAHELGSPLNVISARAKLIAAGNLPESEIRENADVMIGQSERMADIIRQLLDFARLRTRRKTAVDLRMITAQSLRFLTPLASKQNVGIHQSGEDDAVLVQAEAGKIQQVLTNLIVNALQAMPHGGSVSVDIRRHRVQSGDDVRPRRKEYACVSVSDTGEGIPPENIGRLFEPFFTTKDIGEGTGLGLSVAHGIVHDHGGWIDVKSEPGKGSCFTVHLPVSEDQVPS